MKTVEIRRFRRSLRQFERLSQFQLKRCCTEVTLAQCLVLLEVDDAGRPSMGELAARLRLDNSTLSRTIESLVARGAVERHRDESDRRTVRIGLTPSGERTCAEIHDDCDGFVRQLFDNVPRDRRAKALQGFETLIEAFLAWEADEREPRKGDRDGQPQ
jgi:DNA-binding MarR family transcriptional regulator